MQYTSLIKPATCDATLILSVGSPGLRILGFSTSMVMEKHFTLYYANCKYTCALVQNVDDQGGGVVPLGVDVQ